MSQKVRLFGHLYLILLINYTDPGRPLDEKDFDAGRQLSMTPPDRITEGIMMTPLEKTLEELELIGEENMMKRRGGQKTVASSLMSARYN